MQQVSDPPLELGSSLYRFPFAFDQYSVRYQLSWSVHTVPGTRDPMHYVVVTHTPSAVANVGLEQIHASAIAFDPFIDSSPQRIEKMLDAIDCEQCAVGLLREAPHQA